MWTVDINEFLMIKSDSKTQFYPQLNKPQGNF